MEMKNTKQIKSSLIHATEFNANVSGEQQDFWHF